MKLLQKTFESVLAILSAVGNLAKKAKDLSVTVKIKNAVDTSSDKRNFALLAEKTWLDLMENNQRCQLRGLPVNIPADISFTIMLNENGNLTVKVESDYITQTPEKEDKTKFTATLKELMDDVNQVFQELLKKDRSLDLDPNYLEKNKTNQINYLSEFFQDKLNSIIYAVLCKKFIQSFKK